MGEPHTDSTRSRDLLRRREISQARNVELPLPDPNSAPNTYPLPPLPTLSNALKASQKQIALHNPQAENPALLPSTTYSTFHRNGSPSTNLPPPIHTKPHSHHQPHNHHPSLSNPPPPHLLTPSLLHDPLNQPSAPFSLHITIHPSPTNLQHPSHSPRLQIPPLPFPPPPISNSPYRSAIPPALFHTLAHPHIYAPPIYSHARYSVERVIEIT
jgi:hypothetical protein